MGLFSVLDLSAAGLSVQQTRLDVAASNLANARTTGSGEAAYHPLSVVVHSTSSDVANASASASGYALPRPEVVGIVEKPTAPSLVYDPGHPDANKDGYVRLPGIDTVGSMVELESISRGYEANLRVFDVTRSLIQRLLSIGGRS
jgi:flagellar basal-body rod protein FlgC